MSTFHKEIEMSDGSDEINHIIYSTTPVNEKIQDEWDWRGLKL